MRAMSGGILVSGAAGFLGRALSRTLQQRGNEVRRAIRRPSKDEPDAISVGDIGPSTDWTHALRGADRVIHCAARVHMMDDLSDDPLREFRTVNTEGALNLARQAAAAGVKRFVFVSSIKVNGGETLPGRPFTADDMPKPEDGYGLSKAEAEAGLAAIAAATGMSCTVIRPPLVYGPGVKANFASMMRWVARGVPLPFGAVRDNRRSLVGLDNLVDLLIACADHTAAANQTFLVSDVEDLSTAELLQRLGKALGRPARLLAVPPTLLQLGARMAGRADVAKRILGSLQVDIDKTRRLLDWRPPVSVDDGLRRAARAIPA